MKFWWKTIGVSAIWLSSQLGAAPADFDLAKRYYKDEVFTQAVTHYRKFLSENPAPEKLPLARLGLAQSLAKVGKAAEAAQTYQDFLVSHSGHPQQLFAMWERANLLMQTGEYSHAAEAFLRYSTLGKGNKAGQALFLASRAAWKANLPELARNNSEQYLKRYPKGQNASKARLIIGLAAAKELRWNDAIEVLDKSLTGLKDTIDLRAARKQLARAWAQKGQELKAIAQYDSLLQIADRNDSLVVSEEYSGYLENQQKWSALALFLGSWPQKELSAAQQLRLMDAEIRTGAADRALKRLEQASFTQTDHILRSRFLKAEALLSSDQRLAGIRLLRKLGEEGYARAWKRAGDAYLKDEMYQNAIRAYYECLEKNREDNLGLFLKIAEIYENNLGRFGEARRVYEEFVMNFPGHPDLAFAGLGVARCFEKENKFAAAAQAYKRVMEDFPGSSAALSGAKRFEYISDFKIRESDQALQHTLFIMNDLQNPVKPLLMARIFMEDLKELDKAEKQLNTFIEKPNDSTLLSFAHFLRGQARSLMMRKAAFESNTFVQQQKQKEALADFNLVLEKYPQSEWADDAAYGLLIIGPANLDADQKFVKQYPQSNLLPKVLTRIGDAFNEQAAQRDPRFGVKAATVFQRVLNEFPDSDLRAHAMLGASRGYYFAKQFEQASATLKLVQNLESATRAQESEANLILGKIFLAQKEYPKALSRFREIGYKYAGTPSSPEALFLKAQTHEFLSQSEEARRSWRLYISQYPGQAFIWPSYAGISRLLSKSNQLSQALEPLKEYVDKYPKDDSNYIAYEQIGRLHILQSEPNEAVKAFSKSLELAVEPRQSHLYSLSAELYLQLDDFANALTHYNKALQYSVAPGDSATALSGKLSSLIMLGKEKEYKKGYKLFRDRFEENMEAHARILYYDGRHLMENKKEKRALKRFDYLAMNYEETSWAAEGSFYLGLIAYRRGEYDDAQRYFEKYLKQNPGGRSALDAEFRIASCHYEKKLFLRAAEMYESLVNKNGAEVMRYRSAFNAATSYKKLHKWDKAAALFMKVHQDFSKFQPGSDMLVSAGFSWYQAKNYSKAKEAFKKVLEDKKSERLPEAHYWYAKSLDDMGEVENALAEYLKVNYLYRNAGMWGLTATFEVGLIYQRSGDLVRARKQYVKVLDADGKNGSLGKKAAGLIQEIDTKAK